MSGRKKISAFPDPGATPGTRVTFDSPAVDFHEPGSISEEEDNSHPVYLPSYDSEDVVVDDTIPQIIVPSTDDSLENVVPSQSNKRTRSAEEDFPIPKRQKVEGWKTSLPFFQHLIMEYVRETGHSEVVDLLKDFKNWTDFRTYYKNLRHEEIGEDAQREFDDSPQDSQQEIFTALYKFSLWCATVVESGRDIEDVKQIHMLARLWTQQHTSSGNEVPQDFTDFIHKGIFFIFFC